MVCVEKQSDVSRIFEKIGKYQILQYFCACLLATIITIININYVFLLSDIEYRCIVPECEFDTSPSSNFTPPWWPSVDRCSRPLLNHSWARDNQSCSGAFTSAVEQCDQWVYESEDSAISSLNLACDPWRVNLVGTVHNVGLLFSVIVAGILTDRLGRKPTLILCSLGGAIGHLKAFAPNYNVFIVIEFIEAFLSGGSYPAAMVLMIEISNSKGRILAGMLFAYSVYVGETLFALIAMFVPNWKNLLRIIYTPPLLAFLLYFCINESPRWQVLNGKTEEAKKTFKTMAKMNKIEISEEINTQEILDKFNVQDTEKKEGILQILKSKEIMKTLGVVGIARFTVAFVYYGLMINSVFLPGDKYTNFMLASVMSFPGELIALYLMNKIGRKLPLIIGFALCAVLCVSTSYVPVEYTGAKITLFLFGKMVISVCFTGIVTFSMELFPTSTRGTLLGACSVCSRLGSMLAPLTPILSTVSPVLPTLSFAVLTLLSSVLLTLLPETKDRPLQDTITQINTAADNVKKAKEEKRREKEESRQ